MSREARIRGDGFTREAFAPQQSVLLIDQKGDNNLLKSFVDHYYPPLSPSDKSADNTLSELTGDGVVTAVVVNRQRGEIIGLVSGRADTNDGDQVFVVNYLAFPEGVTEDSAKQAIGVIASSLGKSSLLVAITTGNNSKDRDLVQNLPFAFIRDDKRGKVTNYLYKYQP